MAEFLTTEEEAALVEVIREQERRTSAEIRVCITGKLVVRHERFAWNVFETAGMRATKHRNAALIVLMPRVRRIVVIGDHGFDAVVGPEFWRQSVAAMIRRMHDDGAFAALREGLRCLGDTLAEHWPHEDGDVNELSDEILR
jgi:uncharacterized membrane protein